MSSFIHRPFVTPEIEEQAARWWLLYREGELDEPGSDKARSFRAWMKGDARHAQAWDGVLTLAQQLDDLPPDRAASLRAWALGEGPLVRGPAPASAQPGQPASDVAHAMPAAGRRRFLSQAVPAGAVCAAVGVGAWQWLGWHARQPTFSRVYQTALGQLMDAPLPDGSRIRLDTSTRLRVTYFQGRREVLLDAGQAMFEVAKDARRPFHVQAGPVRVTVVGTRFQVRHIGKDVSVEVQEGRVRVARSMPAAGQAPGEGLSADPPAGILLGGGQALRVDEAGAMSPVVAIAPSAVAPWREGRLNFKDVTLAQALAEFARYGDTGLAIADERVARMRISGSFEIGKARAFALALPKVLPVRLVAQGGVTGIVAR